MKFKFILAAAFLAGASFASFAQTPRRRRKNTTKADQLSNAKELLLRNMNNPGTDKSVADYYLGLIDLSEGNQADASKWFNDGKTAKS